MAAFAAVLQEGGIVTTVRKTRGDDIAAACGQLAGEVQDRTRVAERSVRAVPVRVASRRRVAPRAAGVRRRAERSRVMTLVARASPRRPAGRDRRRARGCVAETPQPTPPPRPAPAAGTETRDRVTASDEPEAQQRARARMELASAYFGQNQMTTALDQVKLAIAADPNYGEAFNLRGLIYANLGDQALAEESFKRALQLNPRDADTMHNYG